MLNFVRGWVLLDLLLFFLEKQLVDLFVLELIRIYLIEVLDDENFESELEDEGNYVVNYDSDDDSEFEVDCEMKKIGNEGCGKEFIIVQLCSFML